MPKCLQMKVVNTRGLLKVKTVQCTMLICKCASKDLSQTTRSRKYMIIDNAFTKTKVIAKRSATV